MDSLHGKTAVVTGAASGIGRSMALRFARAGMNVVVGDLNEEGLRAVVAEVNSGGGTALGVPTDVANREANQNLLDATVERFGRANVVCLNAGVTGSVGRSWTLTEQDWSWSLRILLDGVIFGIGTFVDHLVSHGDGHAVLTASVVGHIAAPYSGPYGAAKHAVVALAESLALELEAENSDVGVTCLCPGFVNTAIVTSARERSAGQPGAPKDERGTSWMDVAARALSGGMDPEVVADKVHDAILSRQFWLFTDTMWDDAIAKRADSILGRTPPVAGIPTRPKKTAS